MNKLIDNLMKTEAMHDLLDAVVLERLKESRGICVEERDRLDNIEDRKPHQEEDWQEVVQDIHALDRIINYYGGNL
jgi:hypothetical protein